MDFGLLGTNPSETVSVRRRVSLCLSAPIMKFSEVIYQTRGRGLLIGAVWSPWVTGLTSSYHVFAKIKMAEQVKDFGTCLNEVISHLSGAGLSFTLKTEQERAMRQQDSARVWFFSCLLWCAECEVIKAIKGKEVQNTPVLLLFLHCKA